MATNNARGNTVPEEAVVQRYQQLRQECLSLVSRTSELENELHEHQLVIEALRPLNGDRRCHRLVGGALIERTIADVLPDLEENVKGIQEALDQLNKLLTEKQTAMEEYAKKHGVAVAQQHSQKAGEESSTDATKRSANVEHRGVLA